MSKTTTSGMDERTAAERQAAEAAVWFEGMSAMESEEAGRLPASPMRGMLDRSAARYRLAASALRAQPALTTLVAELAALKTWDELSALTGGTARPESSPFALDALVLRARSLTGEPK